MTETRPPQGIDPRFDPRFQRGYQPSPDEAASTDGPVETDAAPPAAEREPAAPRVAVPPQPAAPAARPDLEWSRRPSERGTAAEPEPGLEPGLDEDDAFPAEFTEDDDEPSPADPWFLAAWGVAVIAIVVGLAFWWAGLMAENPFSGVGQSDRWLQYVGWIVAPSLIQGGLIGLVAMLVWTGIRWTRRRDRGARA